MQRINLRALGVYALQLQSNKNAQAILKEAWAITWFSNRIAGVQLPKQSTNSKDFLDS